MALLYFVALVNVSQEIHLSQRYGFRDAFIEKKNEKKQADELTEEQKEALQVSVAKQRT
jgi:hypothetical protein